MILVLALMGCRDVEPEPFRVQVTSIDAHGGPALPEDRVRAILRRSLDRAPSFAPALRDQRSRRGARDNLVASLEYRELPDAADHGRDLLVRLVVEVPDELEDALGSGGLDATVLLERDAGEAELAADLQLATDRLAILLQARTDLARGTSGAVARSLASDDPELVIQSLEWVRDHPGDEQSRAAADRVADLVDHDDERVGLVAIEALGSIGGPQHVAVLLQRIELADTGQVHRTYDALGRLGGPDAERFLQFAVRNEDEPDRRAAAERALRELGQGSEPLYALPSRGHR